MSCTQLCLSSSVVTCIILAVLLCLMQAFCKWAATLQFSLWPNPVFPYKAHGSNLALQLSPSCHVPAGPVTPSSAAPLMHDLMLHSKVPAELCLCFSSTVVLHLVALEMDLLGVTDVSNEETKQITQSFD